MQLINLYWGIEIKIKRIFIDNFGTREMAENIFLNKNEKPTEVILKHELGSTFDLWNEIKSKTESEYGPLLEDWKFYSKSSGWTMKLLLKKRNLLFITPYKGYFCAIFIFGDKAVEEVNKSSLPDELKNELNNARKYAEGRGLRLEVRNKVDAEYVIELIRIKIKN